MRVVRPCSLLLPFVFLGSVPSLSRAFAPATTTTTTTAGPAKSRSTQPWVGSSDDGAGVVVKRRATTTDGTEESAAADANSGVVSETLTPYQLQRDLLEERLKSNGGESKASDSIAEKVEPTTDLHRALLEARLRMEVPPVASSHENDDNESNDDESNDDADVEAAVVVMSRKAALDSPLAEAISSFVGEEADDGEESVVEAAAPEESDGQIGVAAAVDASPEIGQERKQTKEGEGDGQNAAGSQVGMLGHADILWKLRPPRETSLLKRASLKVAANLIRLDCKLKGAEPPAVLCPKGGQAVLEAYYKEPGKRLRRRKRIARFGITTERGPRSPEIDATVTELYRVANLPFLGVGVGAIIYMFVEPEYRGRGLGELALEAILAVHTSQGCDFTVLVADDDGSGKLVEWYEENGFSRAPKLQAAMGSPDGKFGTTMIAPTSVSAGFFDATTIKWW